MKRKETDFEDAQVGAKRTKHADDEVIPVRFEGDPELRDAVWCVQLYIHRYGCHADLWVSTSQKADEKTNSVTWDKVGLSGCRLSQFRLVWVPQPGFVCLTPDRVYAELFYSLDGGKEWTKCFKLARSVGEPEGWDGQSKEVPVHWETQEGKQSLGMFAVRRITEAESKKVVEAEKDFESPYHTSWLHLPDVAQARIVEGVTVHLPTIHRRSARLREVHKAKA